MTNLEEIPELEDINWDKQILEEEQILQIFNITKGKDELTRPFPCGFKSIDDSFLGGFREGDLVILSGYSGHGKSTLAQTMTYNYSKSNIPCLWFSYEMSIQNLNWKFRQMGCDTSLLAYAPVKLNSFSTDWIKKKIKQGYSEQATKVVFIDNLDFLLPTDIKYGDNETAVYKNVAKELKNIAMELNIIIFLVSHIVKTDEEKEPSLKDIYGSSGIYKLADAVLFIWRIPVKKKIYRDDDEGVTYTNESKLKVGKSRLTGDMRFIKIYLKDFKFLPISNIEDEQIPF